MFKRGKAVLDVLFACLSFVYAASAMAAATSATNVFDPRKFGARGDGKTIDTVSIQKTLDACGKAGGGVVRFTEGTYLCQPIFLHNNTHLQLDARATLRATDERKDYLKTDSLGEVSSSSFHALVNAKGASDIALSGEGTIDGAGARWWIPAKEAKRTNKENPGYTLPRPRLVLLSGCKNVRIEGITLKDSPSFHLVPADCEDVVIENVTVLAPADSPNTDGIDPSTSRRVRISKCRIDVGDDNIAIKSGKPSSRPFACEDITVIDCVFQHGHGLSIGSETAGGVRNLKVERCRFENTENGIRIKSPRGKGGTVENASYSDITMSNVDGAITITCYYPKIPAEDSAQPVTDRTPMFRNLTFKNITATSRRSAGVIVGLPESGITNVLLENVNITAATTGLLIRNANGVRLINTRVEAAEGPGIIEKNAQIEKSAELEKSANSPRTASEWRKATEILSRIHAPAFRNHDYVITSFGAVAGGAKDSTTALHDAIQACVAEGGGRVVVPSGEFLTGAIHLKSGVELHLERDAVLKFSTDPKAYLPTVFTRFEGMECYNYSPLIYACDAENVAVTGEGLLDGQASAENWWQWKGGKNSPSGAPSQNSARQQLMKFVEEKIPVKDRVFGEGSFLRPGFVEMYRCRNVLIQGVSIRRSPMWELHPVLCANVVIRGVNILSHGPNNDGCDPESCRDVLIEDCTFDTGDDCIAIKSGRNNDGRRLGLPSENIIIRHCTMKDGHGGVVIGSEISGGCRNVFAEDCEMDSPHLERVLRLKSNATRGGLIENVFMRNVRVGKVADSVLQIDFLYEEGIKGGHLPQARNIVMQNIQVSHAPRVLNVTGFPGARIDGVRIYDSTFDGVKAPDVIKDAQDVKLVGCMVRAYADQIR